MAAVAGIIIPGVGSELIVLNSMVLTTLPLQSIKSQACNTDACICPAAPHKGWYPAPATNLGGRWQGLDRVPPKLPPRYVSVQVSPMQAYPRNIAKDSCSTTVAGRA